MVIERANRFDLEAEGDTRLSGARVPRPACRAVCVETTYPPSLTLWKGYCLRTRAEREDSSWIAPASRTLHAFLNALRPQILPYYFHRKRSTVAPASTTAAGGGALLPRAPIEANARAGTAARPAQLTVAVDHAGRRTLLTSNKDRERHSEASCPNRRSHALRRRPAKIRSSTRIQLAQAVNTFPSGARGYLPGRQSAGTALVFLALTRAQPPNYIVSRPESCWECFGGPSLLAPLRCAHFAVLCGYPLPVLRFTGGYVVAETR